MHEAAQVQLEGTQRVHISAKYTIMLWCTRLHVYIRTSLIMYVRTRRMLTILTLSIMMACSGICRKSIGNSVNIFVHFSSTPTSILNLTISSESQYNDVSNDIPSIWKYSQLFTHELYQANRFTNAAQRWHHCLFIDCSQTDGRIDGWMEKQVHDLRQFHSIHLADINIQQKAVTQ